MNSLKLLEKSDPQVARLFNPYHNFKGPSPHANVPEPIADSGIHSESAISYLGAHQRLLESLPRDLIGAHLSVKQVIADLRDILDGEDRSEPELTALAEPSHDPGEGAERALGPRPEVPEEHAGRTENNERLFARLRLPDREIGA